MYSGRPKQCREHSRLPRDFLLTDSNFQVTAQCGNTEPWPEHRTQNTEHRTLARGTTMMARPSPCAIKPASGQAPTLLRDVTPDPDVRWDQVAVKEDGRTSCVALWQLHSVETGSWLEASSRILSARLCQHRCLRLRRHNRNEDASVRRNVVLGPEENLRAIN